MLLGALLVGGTIYAGIRTYHQLNASGRLPWHKRWFAQPPNAAIALLFDTTIPNPALQQANQSLVLSSASLGLATAGILWMVPMLTVASIPPMLYVFLPTFQAAWRTLVKERRINNPVLDAVRITVCVVMGYGFIAALNACLQAISQKYFIQAEADFHQRLRALFGGEQSTVWAFVNGAEVQMPLLEVPVGAVLSVAAGEVVPADGVVLYGSGWFNQRFVIGDSQPVWKQAGDPIKAASVVQSGQIYIQLYQTPQPLLTNTIREFLTKTVEQQTMVQQMGEKSADHMAPRMLISFALTLPFLGANHAAAFLTTGFGNHLRTLGPYTVRNFLIPAAEQGIVIKDARALELANLVNVLIFDAPVLTDPVARAHAKRVIQALRHRPRLLPRLTPQPFAVYVFVAAGAEEAGRKLTAELGLDDYFTENLPAARAELVDRLQTSGRFVCYVGTGRDDALIMEKAQVSIAWRSVETVATNGAQVVLLDRDLRQLLKFFDLAATFASKQGFNLFAPIGLDVVDIATTVLMGLDLGYSILFTYGGLLLGAAYARLRPGVVESPMETDGTQPVRPALPMFATTRP